LYTAAEKIITFINHPLKKRIRNLKAKKKKSRTTEPPPLVNKQASNHCQKEGQVKPHVSGQYCTSHDNIEQLILLFVDPLE
jgi:hypothetical protein